MKAVIIAALLYFCCLCVFCSTDNHADDNQGINIVDEQMGDLVFSTNASIKGTACFTNTTCGAVEGRVSNGVYVFKGIPFATPPVRERRWKPPVSLKKSDSCWNGTLKALEFGPFCMQEHPVMGVIGDEDCLHLNVYTPSLDPSANLPVMVWIHGGYLMFSSNHDVDYYPDERTVHDTDMVYVNLNYRLNGFGFLALDILSKQSETRTSGNYGFMDQILGLEWVRDNIKNFGGNPDLVTVFGQSSGGTSVWALLVSPLAKGLFHRAWMSSASPLYEITLEQASKDNLVFLERSNCSDIECIYALTPEQVIKANPSDVYPMWGSPDACDLPTKGDKDGAICIVDGIVVPDAPLNIWKEGGGNDVPLLIGNTAQEVDFLPKDFNLNLWTWEHYRNHVSGQLDTFGKNVTSQVMALYPYDDAKNTPELLLTTLTSDLRTNCGNDIIAVTAAEYLNSPVYRYVTTAAPSTPFSFFGLPWAPRYSFHMYDTFAFFGLLPHFIPEIQEKDMQFQKLMQNAITHFAIEGTMPPGMKWPTIPTGVAVIDNILNVEKLYHGEECQFWIDNGFYAYSWVN
ncbi:para-nitrobenzyl esterase-like [Glandiceps talaboti]